MEELNLPQQKKLSDGGKKKLYDALVEFIDAEIDVRTIQINPQITREDIKKRQAEASQKLAEIISSLEWRVE